MTAAALERVEGLAALFVDQLIDAGIADAERRGLSQLESVRRTQLMEVAKESWRRVEVRTQLATAQGRFVDMELLLRPRLGSAVPALLVWVEVKHGADLHGDQLDAYLHDIAFRPIEHATRVVVLLAPRGWTPEDQAVPDGVLMAAWQDVARAIRKADLESAAEEEQWLRDEYIEYLKEEGLSDPEGLTAVSAVALMEWNEAAEAVAAVAQVADQHVMDHWGPRGSHQKTRGKSPSPDYWPGYYANYDARLPDTSPAAGWGGYVWFEWAVRDTGYIESFETGSIRGSLVFMAGVVGAG